MLLLVVDQSRVSSIGAKQVLVKSKKIKITKITKRLTEPNIDMGGYQGYSTYQDGRCSPDCGMLPRHPDLIRFAKIWRLI